MTTIRDELQALVEDQRALFLRVYANDERVEQLHNRVQLRLSERLKPFKVKVLASVKSGSHTPEWTPEAYVYPFFDGQRSYAKIGGRWCWYAEYLSGGKAYAHKIVKGATTAPFDGAALEAACAELTEELGVQVEIVECELVGVPKELRNIDDLLALMPNAELLAAGKIWEMGWDIPDHWAILRAPEGLHVFYSTNGHGFGYDHHLKPGESVQSFLDLTRQHGFEDAETARNLLKKPS